MDPPVRPRATFVLRLWREPGAQEGDAGWRGQLRPLSADSAASGVSEIAFQGLENIPATLRPLLSNEE
jgi:hypothetical protein